MVEQKVIFIVYEEGKMSIEFDPAIANEGSNEFKEKTEKELMVQNYAAGIASDIIDKIQSS